MNFDSGLAGHVDGRRSITTPILAAVLFALAAARAGAQEAPEDHSKLVEITVTAQKKEESIQEVPLSITALGGETLEKNGSQSFRDWADYVPGVRIYQGYQPNRRAGPAAVMRGVSQSGGGQLNEMSTEATTSYTFGEIPIFSSDPGLFDLNRIEVLRGPQGTLFGVASMGGTIRFIPNEARTDKAAFEAGGGVGTINQGSQLYDVNAMANIPLIENVLAVRFAGLYRYSGGYIDFHRVPLTITRGADISVTPGSALDPRDPTKRDVNKTSTIAGRMSLTFTPGENFTAKLITQWQKSDQDQKQAVDFNDQNEGWDVTRYTYEPQRDEFSVTSLDLGYDLGFGTLKYVGGYADVKLFEQLDVTGLGTIFLNGAVPALDIDGPGGLPPDPYAAPTQFPFYTTTKTQSDELRLQGDGKSVFGTRLTFDYVVGAFYMHERREGAYRIGSPGWNENLGPNTAPILTEGELIAGSVGWGESESHSFFGDMTVHMGRFSLAGGLRYSDTRKRQDGWGFGDLSSGKWTNGARVGDDLNVAHPVRAVPHSTPLPIRQISLTPRATAQYQLSDDKMVYFTAAKGERLPSGPPNPRYWDSPTINPVCRPLAASLGADDDAINGTQSDSVWSYDLGIKSQWLDRRLLFNASVYLLRWTNLQRNVLLQYVDDRCFSVIPANAGAVRTRGFELETVYVPIDSVTLNAAVGYTDPEIESTVIGLRDSLGQQLEKGDSIENVAPWTAAVGAEYRLGLPALGEGREGFARVDWRYTGERINAIGDRPSLRADPLWGQFVSQPYSLTDVRFGVNANDWTTTLYISNITNKRAVFESYGGGFFPNQRVTSISQPRTVGVTFKKQF
jgi:iron complex outermembrane recepter protein